MFVKRERATRTRIRSVVALDPFVFVNVSVRVSWSFRGNSVGIRVSPIYSPSTLTGSTRVARRAGMRQATIPTPASTAATIT